MTKQSEIDAWNAAHQHPVWPNYPEAPKPQDPSEPSKPANETKPDNWVPPELRKEPKASTAEVNKALDEAEVSKVEEVPMPPKKPAEVARDEAAAQEKKVIEEEKKELIPAPSAGAAA